MFYVFIKCCFWGCYFTVPYTNEVRTDDGFIYSLDMVRLNVEYKSDVQIFVTWLNNYSTYSDGIIVNHWLSLREFSYRDLFQIKTENYSFSLAIGFNGKSSDRNKGYIEFNPNKCKGSLFSELMDYFYNYLIKAEVVRFDLAIDIPIPRYLVKLEKDKRNYQYISTKSSDTEYLGLRNNVGFVKLYDKKAESDLEYDLTRLEVTASLEEINFPIVKIYPMQERLNFESMNSTEKVLVQLLKQVGNKSMYLKQLKYEKRKKIEQYLGEDTVQLDYKAFQLIKMQVVKYIL